MPRLWLLARRIWHYQREASVRNIGFRVESSEGNKSLLLLKQLTGFRVQGLVKVPLMESTSPVSVSDAGAVKVLEEVVETGKEECESEQQQIKRCQAWLPTKRRFCSAHVTPGLMFCGNHKPSAAQTRVPCPVDPSHTVLQTEIANHIRKCPATRQLDDFEQQAYYCKSINAGSDDDEEEEEEGLGSNKSRQVGRRIDNVKLQRLEDGTKSISNFASSGEEGSLETQGSCVTSASKRIRVAGLSGPEFRNLVARIDEAFNQLHEEIEESILLPQACRKWLDGERDRRLPYQEKHAVQQASLLGNLEAYGLLEDMHVGKLAAQASASNHEKKQQRAIVELGAGRGYLSQMLCDCYSVHKVLMVERRSYKFKADRTIRQTKGIRLERLRLDIENLKLNEVRAIQECHVIAISKHLCGPATDLSLRCCLRGAADLALFRKTSNSQSKPSVDGLAIATCCHHLCQWKSYVNKSFFRKLGFSKDDFHAITWLTSWALSGTDNHELDPDLPAPADKLLERDISHEGTSDQVASKALLSEAMNALDVRERLSLGRKCKRLIDTGRLLWLKEKGMQSKLVEYIAPSVSPENKLLLARCP